MRGTSFFTQQNPYITQGGIGRNTTYSGISLYETYQTFAVWSLQSVFIWRCGSLSFWHCHVGLVRPGEWESGELGLDLHGIETEKRRPKSKSTKREKVTKDHDDPWYWTTTSNETALGWELVRKEVASWAAAANGRHSGWSRVELWSRSMREESGL